MRIERFPYYNYNRFNNVCLVRQCFVALFCNEDCFVVESVFEYSKTDYLLVVANSEVSNLMFFKCIQIDLGVDR